MCGVELKIKILDSFYFFFFPTVMFSLKRELVNKSKSWKNICSALGQTQLWLIQAISNDDS